MELLSRVQAAIDAPADYTTDALNALNQECGNARCHRRERILYQLQRFLNHQTAPMSAPSTTHQFKKGFSTQKAIVEVDGKTKAVTATNLTDDDVPVLKANGYGHLIEKLPSATTEAEQDDEDGEDDAADLSKLKKVLLQVRYKDVVGEDAPDALTKEELIKAINAKQ